MDLLRHTDFDNKIFWLLFVLHILVGSLYVFFGLPPVIFIAFGFMLLMLTMFSLDLLSSIFSSMLLVVALELQFIMQDDPMISFSNVIMVILVIIATAVIGAGFIGSKAITTQRLNQQKQAASIEHHRLQSLINSMADGVIATDAEGAVVMYNGAALDIMNINVSLEAKKLPDFLKLEDQDGNHINIYEQAEEKQRQIITTDYKLQIDEGEFINLYVSMAPVRIGYGREGQRGYIILLRDITREKSLEEERDEFISVVSHELRTPVTITEGNVSNAQLIIKRNNVSIPEVDDTLEAAHKQIVFLADMINDLSTLSRAERGVIQFDPEPINVAELIKTLENDYKIDVQQKGLVMRTSVQPDIGSLISSRLYVREVLQNFITNAIKYTEKGSITIGAVKNSDGNIAFTIKDSGIGISKADQKMLFHKFFRSEDFRTRQNNGTGLGLYVTQKLASMIKAEIHVTSELNRGSTFMVTVPNLKMHHEHHDSSTISQAASE